MEITYRENENFYVPNLFMPKEEPATYGRFGRMRLKYLKEHRRAVYINLKVSGQLTHHLNEIDREANEMLRLLIEQIAQAQGHHGADESCWPTDMGRGNEQYPQRGGGNCVK